MPDAAFVREQAEFGPSKCAHTDYECDCDCPCPKDKDTTECGWPDCGCGCRPLCQGCDRVMANA